MVHINTEGKFNDNSYLIDGFLFRLTGTLAIYVIENNGERMMIDTSSPLNARRIVKKMKELDIFPVQKLVFTHSHWDHNQGWEKLKKFIGDFEILASEKAIENLKNPKKMNDVFGYEVPPIEVFTPLKEGDIINLNGLEIEVMTFFGHTQDSIALLDKKNKNLFTGDAVMYKWDENTQAPPIMPPDFKETEILKTFKKLRELKDDLNSISLAHYGVLKGDDLNNLVNEAEDLYIRVKESLIQWYNENPSIDYLAKKYHEKYIPNSTIHPKENLVGLHLLMEWMEGGLKSSGFVS